MGKAAHLKIFSEIKNSMPEVEVAPVTNDELDLPPLLKKASDELDLRTVAIPETTDDIEVIGAEQETVANTVPFGVTPVHYYAPQQGYYHVPATPAVVQAPAQTPVAYYAPYHGY